MSALGTAGSHLTTARINDHRVPVHLGHRSAREQYRTAVLFDWNWPDGELDDDDTVLPGRQGTRLYWVKVGTTAPWSRRGSS